MRMLPLLVFAAAAGVGSGMASFKYASQLNYDNAMLTLRVNRAERELAEFLRRRAAPSDEAPASGAAAGVRPGRASAPSRELERESEREPERGSGR